MLLDENVVTDTEKMRLWDKSIVSNCGLNEKIQVAKTKFCCGAKRFLLGHASILGHNGRRNEWNYC